MSINKSLRALFYVYIILLLSSCRKEFVNLNGKIFSIANYTFIDQAKVTIDGTTVQTNKNGVYKIPNLKINTEYVINIEQKDYISITRKIKLNLAKDLTANFPLIPRGEEQIFNATDSIICSMKGGGRIIVKPNSFVTKDNKSYIGKVSIKATFINPKENNLIIAAPSTFISSDNRPLQTFGMFEVYATTVEGERLEISREKPILVEIPNISQLTNNVGLYFLNTDSGLWVNNGILTYDKPSNTLLGQVTTISSAWNADDPCATALVCVRIQVVDGSGNPRPYFGVGAKGVSYLGYTGISYTDANGFVDLFVCPNQVIKFVGDIIPCCDPGDIPGTAQHTFCCINSGQAQGPTVDLSLVTLTTPCTSLGTVIFP